MAEAEQMRQKEIDEVIAEIREKMNAYGLTLRDIGGDVRKTRKRNSRLTGKAVKYRRPEW